MTFWQRFQRSPVLQGGSLALAYFLFAWSELGNYGPTWDISIGEIPHGERYLDYLQTGDEIWLDFAKRIDDSPPPAPHPIHDPVTTTIAMTWAETCPLGGILSAVTCRLLFESLGIATPMVAHLVIAPAFAAALMFVLFVLMSRLVGTSAAIGSVLL